MVLMEHLVNRASFLKDKQKNSVEMEILSLLFFDFFVFFVLSKKNKLVWLILEFIIYLLSLLKKISALF